MRTIAFDHPYHGAIRESFATKRDALAWAVESEHTIQCDDIRCDITSMATEGHVNAAASALMSATDELHFLYAVTSKFGAVSRRIADREQSEWWESVEPFSRQCVECNAISHGDYDHIPETCVSCDHTVLKPLD